MNAESIEGGNVSRVVAERVGQRKEGERKRRKERERKRKRCTKELFSMYGTK
jgi:hypothetical protein